MKEEVLERSKKWVAGVRIEDALEAARKLNKENIWCVINKPGEHYVDENAIRTDVEDYLVLLEKIIEQGLNASISVKLTQLGLGKSFEDCLENYRKIVSKSSELGVRICIDMEESEYYSDTMKIYYNLLENYSGLRIAIQCNRIDSLEEVKKILEKRGTVRLCKGAYTEQGSDYFKTKEQVDESFMACAEAAAEYKNSALATADMNIINTFLGKGFEFQTLLGYGEELEKELLVKNEKVSRYVPFGENWLKYCSRRDPWFEQYLNIQ